MHLGGITIHRGRIEVTLAFDPSGPLRTSQVPGLVDSVRGLLPGVFRHRCTSPGSGLFASEAPDTEIAHLFEHMVLELMVMAGSPRTLEGRTDWDFPRDGSGVFHTTLACDDDSVAVGAVHGALEMLDALLDGREPPSPTALVAQLADARSMTSSGA